MCHRHHFFPRKQHFQPTNTEQMTPTLPNTNIEPTNIVENLNGYGTCSFVARQVVFLSLLYNVGVPHGVSHDDMVTTCTWWVTRV
jgi:hypothetical protein